MTTYVARRLIQFVFILFGLSLVFFFILHLTPGGSPCQLQASTLPGVVAKYHACILRYGVNKPLPQQYIIWLTGYFHGDLGYSLNGIPVRQEILHALPVTGLLALSSYLVQQLIALPLGIFSALKQYSFFDTVFTFISYVGLSTPTFFLGLMLLFGFTVQLRLFPAGRVVSTTSPPFWTDPWFHNLAHNPPGTIGDLAYHLVLPAFTLMFVGIAGDSRFMRASMLDVIHQDYIRTAKAKGLSRRSVIFKHTLRNAILPIITNVALFLPTLVGGFIITEAIFSYFGVGYLFLSSLLSGDYQVAQAFLMLSALAVLLANLLADLSYAWADPRIRYD
jgi:peptide/nickel transport system permease protein